MKPTVKNPVRMAFPGIYGNPKDIAAEAASRVAPEDPAMKRLFGVNRAESYEMSKDRKGNMEPDIALASNPRGSEAAQNIMVPRNAQRLQDVLEEGGKHEGLRLGMDSWYHMDPVYDHIAKLVGHDEAKRYYNRLNHAIGMMSPASDVVTEINRGLGANYLMEQGRLSDFEKHGGTSRSKRGPDFPPDMEAIKAHAYHGTSQAPPLRKWADTGKIQSDAPKVPLYVQASGVPATGFQTKLPVPDAHFTRALGLPDTRGGKDYGVSMKMPELQSAGPWFREKVAKKLGLEAVPAQARLWGTMSGQTGVNTDIGSPKMELLSKEIMRIAKRNGVSPEEARDKVLLGKMYASGGAVEPAPEPIREPTEAQKAAGNYKKHHTLYQGIPITIENVKGTTRKGKGWQVQVPYHYGYIKRTEGADGDHVDVCIGDNAAASTVFIVDQKNLHTGKFDEHKAMLGYDSREAALDAYHRGFSDGRGPDRVGAVTRLTVPEFKLWLKAGNTKKATRGQGHIDRALALVKRP